MLLHQEKALDLLLFLLLSFLVSCVLCFCCYFRKGKEEDEGNCCGGVLDAIDHGHELVRIPKTVIKILTSFCVSTENSVNLIFRANLRHVTNKVKTVQR